MRILILLLCVFPVYADYICEVHESDSQCAARYGQDNVVYIEDVFKFSSGSGVRISDSLVITAAHVTEKMMPLFDGLEPEYHIESNEGIDISLYRVEFREESEYADIIEKMPTLGTVVYALGYPGAIDYTMTSGYWMGSSVEGEPYTGYHSAQIYPGSSGGALVTIVQGKRFREVKLVGLTNWGAITDQGMTTMGWVLKGTYILKFLEEINDQADR